MCGLKAIESETPVPSLLAGTEMGRPMEHQSHLLVETIGHLCDLGPPLVFLPELQLLPRSHSSESHPSDTSSAPHIAVGEGVTIGPQLLAIIRTLPLSNDSDASPRRYLARDPGLSSDISSPAVVEPRAAFTGHYINPHSQDPFGPLIWST